MTTTQPAVKVGMPCPRCGFALVSAQGATPWCGHCEWNLNVYEPDRRRLELAWRWQDRWAHRNAYEMNDVVFADLAGQPLPRPRRGASGWFIIASSALTLLAFLGLLAFGVVLAARNFPSWWLVPGLFLIGVGLVIRPKFGKVDPQATSLSRTEAPALWNLVAETARTIGTAEPHRIVFDDRFRVVARRVGPTRQRILVIGLPMWGALGPQLRVAAVAQALAGLNSGDVTSGAFSGHVLASLDGLAGATAPTQLRTHPSRGPAGLAAFAAVLANLVVGLIHQVVRAIRIGVTMVSRRSAQRSRYYVDRVAAEVAGSDAVVDVCDVATNSAMYMTLVQTAARGRKTPAEWRGSAANVMAELAAQLPVRRQLSQRDGASMLAANPPSGLRARLVMSRPQETARVVLSGADSARIDQELAAPYEQYMKDVRLS